MPAPTSFDLAKLDAWCGCRPGMTRVQVEAALQAAAVKVEAYGPDNLNVTEDEWELELYFAHDGSDRLRQLSIDGDAVNWNGRPLMDLPLDEALRTIQPQGPWLWTSYDAVDTPFPDPSETTALPVTDEALLLETTIWLPERGLGLAIYEGAVFGVVWRSGPDLPAQYAGPVTDAQRELSRRTDLATYLREKQSLTIDVARPNDSLRFVRGAITLVTFAALALTAREGIKEMGQWGNAPTVKAKLLAVERGPLKQFFEYLPQPVTQCLPRWLLAGRWSGMPPETDLYRVEFTDAHDQRREALLETAEFYVPPREIGEEVDVVYLDEDPPRVKGPSRVRDAALIEHIPWAISIGALWLLAQVALGLLPLMLRLLGPVIRKLLPSGKTIDPDRPELS
ncbi:MAG: hypothetical protein WCF18_04820 [Chthoniobacteraceae bacterium]